MEALAAFLSANPDLPEGTDAAASDEPQAARLPVLTMSMERKGRCGKTATIIAGFDTPEQAADTAATLKKRLATGGSCRDCEVLLQGDRRDDVRRLLASLGFKVKG